MHTEKCAHTHIYIYSHTCTSTALTEVLRNKCFENKDIYFLLQLLIKFQCQIPWDIQLAWNDLSC